MATRTQGVLIWLGALLMCQVINGDQYCLKCNMADSVSDCTSTVKCAAGEVCYTDEIIHAGTIVYNAGCRQFSACEKPNRGKRETSDNLVACSRCCNGQDRNATGHCNDRLCGLPRTAFQGTGKLAQCYICDHVHDLDDCNEIATCQQDQVCGTQTHLVSGGGSAPPTLEYYFGCYRKDQCLAVTKFVLEHKRANDLYTGLTNNTGITNTGVGRRRSTDIRTCNICCGGNFCNTGDCIELVDKLYALNSTGHLNLDTLEYIP